MEYVLTENGNIKIGKNGHPLTKDGEKEYEVDAIGAGKRIGELSNEAKGYRQKKSEYKDRLTAFEGIDPVEARKAIDTVASLDDKQKLIVEDANKSAQDAFRPVVEKLQKEVDELKADNFNIGVTSKFASSEVLKKTVLTPDIASTFFGKNFSRENGKTVGKINDKIIFSKMNPGQEAGFEEALEVMIEQYPQKDSILKSKAGHGGGGNFQSGSDDGNKNLTSQESIAAGLEARQK